MGDHHDGQFERLLRGKSSFCVTAAWPGPHEEQGGSQITFDSVA
jgi:hypothetical protein